MVREVLIEGDRAVFRGYGMVEEVGFEEWRLFAARKADVCVDITRRALEAAAIADSQAKSLASEKCGPHALELSSENDGIYVLYRARAFLPRYRDGVPVHLTWDDIDRFLDEAQQAAPQNKPTRRP